MSPAPLVEARAPARRTVEPSGGRGPAPWTAWVLLGAGLLAVSSAGAVLQSMSAVPPIMRAAWRLQATALVLLPGFILQWRAASPALRGACLTPRTFAILSGSAVALTLHFALWVWSLDHTSLAHSLLWVTAHPLVFVIGMLLLRHPTRRGQIIGAILGFGGGALTLLDISGGSEVTLLGDVGAFAGGVAVVGYIVAASILRPWMPIFLYAFPITAAASLGLIIASLLTESTTLTGLSELSVLGWLSVAWVLPVGYLALGPGLVGHTGINATLRHLSPLVVSVTLVMEPLVGSIIGWGLRTAGVPGVWTWIGGPLMIAGTVWVTISSQRTTERVQRDALLDEDA